MKMRFISTVLMLSGVLALSGCSGGNDDGCEGSTIGLEGDSCSTDTSTDTAGLDLALGTGHGSTFSEGTVTASSTIIAALGQVTFQATLVDKNSDNSLVSDLEEGQNTVNFTSNCVQSGTATFESQDVTSTTGLYTAVYNAGDGCVGTDTITATYGGTLTATTSIEVEEPVRILAIGTLSGTTFSDGALVTSLDTLSAGGQTTITANIVDRAQEDSLATFENTVAFTSSCSEQGLATITESVNTSTGIAVANYVAAGCVGTDTITATLQLEEDSPTAITTLTVASSIPGGLQFESIDNPVLSINGFGSSSRPESTKIRFRVVDDQDLPIKGAEVTFSLTNTAGGTSLLGNTGESDADGIAIATLIAGRVNTTVAVRATIVTESGETLGTLSDQVSINTGLPDQNSFSLSTSSFFPQSADIDGTPVTITIRAADGYNNPVRNGTVINFRTESGSIDPTCTIENDEGSCAVTWRSQAPRPLNIETEAWAVITAYTEGEETIENDPNANGLYDPGEPFEALPEVFEDVNRDGAYNTTEGINGFDQYVDFNQNGSYDQADSVNYNGLRCSEAALAAGHCSSLIQVRESLNLCITGGVINFIPLSVENFTVQYQVKDQFGNSLPSGTTISVAATNGDIISGRTETTIGAVENTEVLVDGINICNEGFQDTVVGLPDPDSTEPLEITISISVPGGLSESVTYQF